MTTPTPGGPDPSPPRPPAAGHELIDAFTEALSRGDAGDPGLWLRGRGRGLDRNRDRDDPSAVAALQAVGLLVQNREALRALRGSPGRDGPGSANFPSSALNRASMSDPSSRPAASARPKGLLDDEPWLRSHQLEALGYLDVDGGGMGAIALAWHTGMKREVVLKVARQAYLEERFRREIEVHAKLGGHANIAVTRTPLTYRGAPVLVVDYVPGLNLRRRVRADGPLPWPEACDCVRQAALGLEHAHKKGVVHRDVKSSNLVRSGRDDVVCVIDWGLALDRETPDDRDEGLTAPGQLLGTPEYCPPEQAADATSVTPAADLYGLGCVFYELVTGSVPFWGDRKALGEAHASAPVPPLDPGLGVPEAVEHVIRKLLDKKPGRRYATAGEFIAALDEALPRPGGAAATASVPVPKALLAAVAALALIYIGWRSWPTPVKLEARDLVIELSDLAAKPERSGRIGTSAFAAREGDQVSLRADLSAPAYSYLLSFRPDGQMELCLPTRDTDRPELTASPSSPADRVVALTDGLGLQAFAVVTSHSPLPDFQTWRAQQGPPPWKATAADPGVVLRFDGKNVETLKAGEPTRGAGVSAGGARGAVAVLAEWLKSRQGFDTVYLKAFAVLPARP